MLKKEKEIPLWQKKQQNLYLLWELSLDTK